MVTFFIIWLGQLASLIGSEMTNFAVTIWAWETTGQATPLSLLLFFSQTPKILAALFAGVIVDRFDRKQLLMIGDGVAGLSTIVILLLFLTNDLQIWHLYLTGAINGLFSQIQTLTFLPLIALMVPKKHYTRASAMNGVQQGIAYTVAPMSAGFLYAYIGFSGVLTVDLITFIIAIATIIYVRIPPGSTPENITQKFLNWETFFQELTFGFNYLSQRPSLVALLSIFLVHLFILNTNVAILSPMVLARSGTQEKVLGTVMMIFGIGNMLSAVFMTIWGGTKNRVNNLLLGRGLQLGSLMMLGLFPDPIIWIIFAFSGGFFALFPGSFYQSIWLSKVDTSVQGKVFATRSLISQIVLTLALVIGGPMADYLFEPAMEKGAVLANLLGGIFGTGEGAGMALQCALLSAIGVLLCLLGYRLPLLQNLEKNLPDCDYSSLEKLP
ncbi:MFS transporter [Cyanothece sp. BG0011]|uniref:MFS transporter n=1 Tax=Cyanothece sp. BG0011 TaxID=2082950 RepID=UPI000D1E9E75|nr:MFS transporter [Cyanothece sp. BG0011]